ncbi:hypothetical protein C3L33_11351, partial [Rhododendron williamsianum]
MMCMGRFQRNSSSHDQPMLNVTSLAHVLHVFVNGLLVGSAHGTPTSSITLETKVSLNNGINNVSLLSVMVGLPVFNLNLHTPMNVILHY